jgi:hypothetical protein
MTTYPPWYNSFPAINNSSPFSSQTLFQPTTGLNPTPSFGVPQISLENNHTNQNYNQTGFDFLNQYCMASAAGIHNLANAYNFDATCSMHVFKQGQQVLHEMQGFTAIKNKFTELQVSAMRYKDVAFTFQPIGKNSILASFCGKVEINCADFMFNSTMVIKVHSSSGCKVSNHMFQFFLG